MPSSWAACAVACAVLPFGTVKLLIITACILTREGYSTVVHFLAVDVLRWWSGIVISALASINEVNLRWAWLVLRWATVCVRVLFPVPDIYFDM